MIPLPATIGRLESGAPLVLPEEAVTQGFAILARRRSGKSVLAGVMMETFCQRGDPWACLDPVSGHWGIKYRDRKGQPGEAAGLDVLIVGGKYGDVPLDEHMGNALAEILCETNISCVVDLKMASMAARKRFVTDFANRLFAVNETPRHIFLEEAHEFVPQTPRWEEQKLVLGALERLIKGGGGQGIGFTLISQRPASVSKEVLTQIDNLFVLRMSGPRDLDAVKEWFEHNVGDREQMRAILSSLPAFKPGDAWLLSPEWLGEIGRLRVRERVTYHAGRTPKRGEGPVKPARVDVSAVIQRFQKAAEQRQFVVQQDVDLKKENARLKRELQQRPAPVVDEGLVERTRAAEAGQQQLRGQLEKGQTVMRSVTEALDAVRPGLLRLLSVGDQLSAAASEPAAQKPVSRSAGAADGPRPSVVPRTADLEPRAPAPAERRAADGDSVPPAGAMRMLQELAARFPLTWTQAQLGTLSGFSYKGGTFRTYRGILKRLGYIQLQGRDIAVTAEGMAVAGEVPEQPTSHHDAMVLWQRKLPAGCYRMLEAVADAGPSGLSQDDLAIVSGFERAGGTFRTYRGILRRNGLVEIDGQVVRACDILWPDGVPA